MMPRKTIAVLGACLALLLSTSGALARQLQPIGTSESRLIRVAERAVSMRDAINRVRQLSSGRILDAQDRGNHYRIKVLTQDGIVRVYSVDAATGAVR